MADLCEKHPQSPVRLARAEVGGLRDLGARRPAGLVFFQRVLLTKHRGFERFYYQVLPSARPPSRST